MPGAASAYTVKPCTDLQAVLGWARRGQRMLAAALRELLRGGVAQVGDSRGGESRRGGSGRPLGIQSVGRSKLWSAWPGALGHNGVGV